MEAFLKYVEQGGYVMPPLILAAMILWYGIGYRLALLWRGGDRHPRAVVKDFFDNPSKQPRNPVERAAAIGVSTVFKHATQLGRALEHEFMPLRGELNKFRVLTKVIVAVSPLLGLLGTVSGMIETFSALGDMTLFSQSGGIAGGISQALLTTQFGLSIAIPGLLMRNFLEMRQRLIESQIDEVFSILSGKAAQA
ncbi:MAG: MotA/TolQ/ExbB proton channel family protein [Myxococcota bacterium]